MGWTSGRCQRLLKLALKRHRLLEPGDSVVVGVSGGADSLCLLSLLHEYGSRWRAGWQIRAVHVHPGFPGWDAARVERACARIGVTCCTVHVNTPALLRRAGSDSCFLCARARRRVLFLTAREMDCRKVALAHHMEDVNETFLLNLLFTSSGATFLPRQPLFSGTLEVVRPLYYFDKELIGRYLKQAGIRAVRNRCPQEHSGARMMLRRFANRLYRTDRRISTNLFWGIHNLKPAYLPGPARQKQVRR